MTSTRHSRIIRPLGLGAALALGITGGVATVASAQQNGNGNGMDKAEVQALQSAPTTLGDAVKAAESNTGGKAMSAEFDNSGQAGAYRVEIAKQDGSIAYVMVDASEKSVTPMAAGPDNGMGNDKSEGENGSDGNDTDADGSN